MRLRRYVYSELLHKPIERRRGHLNFEGRQSIDNTLDEKKKQRTGIMSSVIDGSFMNQLRR